MGGGEPLVACVTLPASSPPVLAGVLDLPDPLLMHCLGTTPHSALRHCCRPLPASWTATLSWRACWPTLKRREGS